MYEWEGENMRGYEDRTDDGDGNGLKKSQRSYNLMQKLHKLMNRLLP